MNLNKSLRTLKISECNSIFRGSIFRYLSQFKANEIDFEDRKQNFINTIFDNILLETKDFYLIDKPAGVSLFRSKPKGDPNYVSKCSEFAVQDIIPDLCSKLEIESQFANISSELPWNYSGLFVFSKNKQHYETSKKFFKTSSYGMGSGYISQSYRCLCWNRPINNQLDTIPFSFRKFYPDKTDYQNSIIYKSKHSSKNEINTKSVWTKHIGHDVVSYGNLENDKIVLIDVKCNSSYRGLVQLYLLHQGSIVVGEFLQASRLVTDGVNNDICILPPEKANAVKPLPIQFRQRLGTFGRELNKLPLHIHCIELLVPSNDRKPKTESYLSESKFNFNSRPGITINWDHSLKLNVCSYHSVPDYYSEIMKHFNISLPLN